MGINNNDKDTIHNFKKYSKKKNGLQKLSKKYNVTTQTIKKHMDEIIPKKETKKRKKEESESDSDSDSSYSESESEYESDLEVESKKKKVFSDKNMDNQTENYAICETIGSSTYLVVFRNMHVYTDALIEIVTGSDSKAIKIIFQNDLEKQDILNITSYISKTGAPITSEATNLISRLVPTREFLIEFQEPVEVNSVKRDTIVSTSGIVIANIFIVKKLLQSQNHMDSVHIRNTSTQIRSEESSESGNTFTSTIVAETNT
ncbi:hypothetical protein ACTFIZ_010637 [Dictyostelium cf. discoideum]